jgi:hypothetical protein
MTSNMAITKIELMDRKLSRISGCQPQLCWWSLWPPDLNFGRQKRYLVAQATILVDKIKP